MNEDRRKIHRLLAMITLMQSGRQSTLADLMHALSVSERTVFRYLQTLTGAGIPWELEPQTGNYRVRRDFFLAPVQLTIAEALSVLVLVDGIIGTADIDTSGQASQGIDKLLARLPSKMRDELGSLRRKVRVNMPAGDVGADAIRDVHDGMTKAIHTGHALKCRYASVHSTRADKSAAFTFKPYGLVYQQRAWFAIGLHETHGQIRWLKLARFEQVTPTKITYTIPADFSVEKHSGLAWRMVRGDKRYDVRIHFRPPMADTIAEGRWHGTQEIINLDDGNIEFRCTVDGLDEIVWWVLGYGPAAKVIEPKELADKVKLLAQQTVDRYREQTD